MHQNLLLHLSLIKGLGPVTVGKLLNNTACTDLYTCTAGDLMRNFHISAKVAHLVVSGLQDKALLEAELQLIERHAVSWVTIADNEYPPLLKNIEYPPLVLYYRGAALHTFTKNIAVIGSRKAGQYAEQVIAESVPGLIASGWCVVSGGAIGADTMAHMHTVAHEGKTVAILGSGLLSPYPSSNKKLFELIINKGGAVVSPFPLTTTAYPGNFPARNRIIAGMSQACLVVQAAERSGASITAHFALEQGKQVLSVPGSIFDPLSAGCHALIKEGATPILSPDDLLKELGEQPCEQISVSQETEQLSLLVKCSSETNKLVLSEDATVSERILFYCKEPQSVEDLLAYINQELSCLQDCLFDLQLAGQLEQNAVGLWQIVP